MMLNKNQPMATYNPDIRNQAIQDIKQKLSNVEYTLAQVPTLQMFKAQLEMKLETLLNGEAQHAKH